MLLNIEKHHRKAYLEKKMRGAAALRTPRLKRKDTLHAYRVAANATDSNPNLNMGPAGHL